MKEIFQVIRHLNDTRQDTVPNFLFCEVLNSLLRPLLLLLDPAVIPLRELRGVVQSLEAEVGEGGNGNVVSERYPLCI